MEIGFSRSNIFIFNAECTSNARNLCLAMTLRISYHIFPIINGRGFILACDFDQEIGLKGLGIIFFTPWPL